MNSKFHKCLNMLVPQLKYQKKILFYNLKERHTKEVAKNWQEYLFRDSR